MIFKFWQVILTVFTFQVRSTAVDDGEQDAVPKDHGCNGWCREAYKTTSGDLQKITLEMASITPWIWPSSFISKRRYIEMSLFIQAANNFISIRNIRVSGSTFATHMSITINHTMIVVFYSRLRRFHPCPPHIRPWFDITHFSDVIMSVMASQITGISIVCSIVGLGADQGKCQSSASLAFVKGIHRWIPRTKGQ